MKRMYLPDAPINAAGLRGLVRRLKRRREVTDRWKRMFRAIRVDAKGVKVRRQGEPRRTKRQLQREFLAAAQEINPAIRTVRGARKLERRLERGKAGGGE